MNTKYLFIILLTLAAMFTVWFNDYEKALPLEKITTAQRPKAQVYAAPAVRSIANAPTPVTQNIQIQAGNPIRDVQSQLIEAQELLGQHIAELERLNQQKLQQEKEIAVTSPIRILQNDNQISQLGSLLENHRAAEKDLTQAEVSAITEQNRLTERARDQIEPEIASQEIKVQQIQEQLNFWINEANGTPQQKEARQIELQNALAVESNNLQVLRDQRVQISEQILQQTQNLSLAVQLQKSEIADNQNAIQDQILTLKDDNTNLQTSQIETRQSLMSLDQEIELSQKRIATERNRIIQLERNLAQSQ